MPTRVEDFQILETPELWEDNGDWFWIVWGEDKGCLCIDGTVWFGNVERRMRRYDTLEDAYMASDIYYDDHGRMYPYTFSEGVMYNRDNLAVVHESIKISGTAVGAADTESEVMEFI